MGSIAGMSTTGRKIAGPASDLVEVNGGRRHQTAIVFHREYLANPDLTAGVEVVLPFLEQPDVDNVAELAAFAPEEGAFVYDTGDVWSVAEILAEYAGFGEAPGVRAGLELCYLVGIILHEMSEVGPDEGLYCHGGLDPWRVLLRADGRASIIGYGVPAIEMSEFRDDESRVPKEDSFRYCPPERIEGEPEDVTSDVFSLALIGFELMVGKPLYGGLTSEVRQQATSGQGPYRLYQFRDDLPEPVREMLSRALKPDMDSRYADANEFVWAVKDVMNLPEIEGPSLAEVVNRARSKSSAPIVGGKTASISKEELAALRDMLDGPDAAPLPKPPRERPSDEPEDDEPARWGRSSRGGRRPSGRGRSEPAERQPAPAPKRENRAAALRDRLRNRTPDEAPRSASRGSREGPAAELKSSRADSLRARLRRSSGNDQPPRRRGRRQEEEEPVEADPISEEVEPEAEEEAQDDGQGSAAALLQRLLRSSSGRSFTRKEARTATPAAPPRVAAPPPAPPPPPPVATPAPMAEPVDAAQDADDDDRVAVEVIVPGGARRQHRLPGSHTLAVAVTEVMQREAIAVPADLGGRITGWYRFHQANEILLGHERVDEVDPEVPVELVLVKNVEVLAGITVEVDPPVRFRAPVGTAVPAGSLLAHLVQWLKLGEGNWSLSVGDERVEPLQILDDFEPVDGVELVVTK